MICSNFQYLAEEEEKESEEDAEKRKLEELEKQMKASLK